MAYDPLENNVAYHDDNEREVRRYAPDLSGPPTSRFTTGLWDTRHIAAWGALALDPPPLPLNAQGDTDTFLWMLGNHDGEGVHRYQLILAD